MCPSETVEAACPSEGLDGYAVETIGGDLRSGVILICDHASNAIPKEYGTLGLPPRELERHIAYDIGAAAVTRALASSLNAPAVLTRQSRLLIDCNRGADDPTLIMRLSDGAVIPGNRVLDGAERQRRIARYYAPYHRAISALIDTCLAAGAVPAIVSMHSFTPVWRDKVRPWHAGVLWDRDDRLANLLIAGIGRDGRWTVGDNQPYSGRLKGDTLWQHGTARGLPHALVEIRQDLISDAEGQTLWTKVVAGILRSVLEDPETTSQLLTVRHYGSHAV